MGKNKKDGISRPERAAMARALVEKGYTRKQIMEILGIGQSYVGALLSDPDGTKDKLRKEQYRGTCIECGGKTTYARSHGKPVHRCSPCARKHQHSQRVWTPERIIADLQEWNRIYGEPPKAMDWLTGVYGDGTWGSRRWPHVVCVQREFGSWSNALEAAGFERRINYERTDEWKTTVQTWSKEQVIEKIKEWAARYGVPPTSGQWHGTGGKWPSAMTAAKRFGTWNNAIRAAGFVPLAPGHRRVFAEWERRLVYGENGSTPATEIPSFESRGEGKSLLDVVENLKGGRGG